jgi:hypothetical protein
VTLLLALVLLASPPQRAQGRKPAPHRVVHAPARRRPARRRIVRRRPGISSARALEIQHALMAAGYLERASGRWDEATRLALLRLQRAHHWQTRYIPDARALIALGLGPASAATATAAAAPGDRHGGG